MTGERERLAVALADGFLAGEWTSDGLRIQGETVLEARPAWLRRLVREVIAAYPEPPFDRPRELLRFVRQTEALAELDRRAGRRERSYPVPLHRLSEPTSMVRRPFPVVRLDHAGDLAELLGLSMEELLWFADTKGLLRHARPVPLQHYRSTWVPSTGGGRLLEAPLPRLKAVQRQILEQVLTPIPVHDAAHGFVAGRSARTGAAPHVGAEMVISLDLESFFASISGGRVYGVLRTAGYPEPLAHLLTGLCTHASSVRALAASPRSAAASAFRLRRRLAQPHLPQGAPTSPQLANLCAFGLDRRLSAYASAVGARYTRYADDLTFSGDALAVRQRGIVAAVTRIVGQEGFVLNSAKTRMRGSHTRQEVTGSSSTPRPPCVARTTTGFGPSCTTASSSGRRPRTDCSTTISDNICAGGLPGFRQRTASAVENCWPPSIGSSGPSVQSSFIWASTVAQMSWNALSWVSDNGSNMVERTVSAWLGATSTRRSWPASVRIATWPRLSPGACSRLTQP